MNNKEMLEYVPAVNLGLNVAKYSSSIVPKFVKNFFSKDKKPEVISPALAVGYFNNFIIPISDEINNNKTITLKKEDSSNEVVESDKIKIKLVIPSSLDIKSFKACKDEIKNKSIGRIFSSNKNRDIGINYLLSETKELLIVDYATTVTAIKFYYEEVLKFDIIKNTDQWNKIQSNEILAFEDSIKTMLTRGAGVLTDKIEFNKY